MLTWAIQGFRSYNLKDGSDYVIRANDILERKKKARESFIR